MQNVFNSRLPYTVVSVGVVVLVALLTTLLSPPAKEVAAALDNEPTRKTEIIIQSSLVSATLTDFPVLLTEDTIPAEACDADGTSPAQEGGGDVRFTSDANGNNQLPLEVVKFDIDNDPANCVAEMYVKVPTVSASTDTSIWMWYNTSTSDSQPAASSTYGSQNVWDSNFKGVWHLDESSGARSDSTANANNLTDNNTVVSATGKWNTAADFESSNSEYLSIADASQSGLDITGGLTMAAWVNLETTGSDQIVMGKWNGQTAADKSFFTLIRAANVLGGTVSSNGTTETTQSSSNTLSGSTWHHVAVVYEPSTRIEVYVDGVSRGTNTTSIPSSLHNSGVEFSLGRVQDNSSGVAYFDGLIQAARVAAIDRSDDWISAEYNNQSDPATFAIEQAPQQGTTAPDSSTVIKSANENVTSSTTLQNDDEFSFALEANTKYVIDGGVFATSTASQPDIKIGFTVPSGATMDIGYLAQGGNSRTAELLETSGAASAQIDIAANSNTIIQPFGSVVTGGTAGNLVFQWAQNSSNATATTVKQGSFVTVTKVTE